MRIMDDLLPTVPLWFCAPCTYMQNYGDDIRTDDSDPTPLSAIGDDIVTLTSGMLTSEHGSHCTVDDRINGICACDVDEHSTRSCDGCGNHLHGYRHAFTGWRSPATDDDYDSDDPATHEMGCDCLFCIPGA